jgi:3-oxoacyl-[acyl-carrier protein] reductase
MELDKKVALVTGASRGIGRAIAVRLGETGASVVVNYSGSQDAAQETVAAIEKAGGRAIAVQADVAKLADVKRLWDESLQKFGRLDILVNNAGVMFNKLLADVTEEEFDRIFAVNVKGTFFACQQAAKRLADGGRIINFSSSTTALMLPTYGAYVATKGAVEQMSHVLAKELGSRGSRSTLSRRDPPTRNCSAKARQNKTNNDLPSWRLLEGWVSPRTSPMWWLCSSATRLVGSRARISASTEG